MSISRRRLLRLAVGLPAGIALAPLAASYTRAMGSVAAHVRPAPDGTSDTRCAACGSADHAMLDAACPARPRLPRAGAR